MNKIIWIHDQALKKDHAILNALDSHTKAIFIWDDTYFRDRHYSLKRLVFIYESLCEMPILIFKGSVYDVIASLCPCQITTFFTTDSKIQQIIQKLSQQYAVEVIQPKPFVQIVESHRFKRFFNYWNQAQKTAFIQDGGISV